MVFERLEVLHVFVGGHVDRRYIVGFALSFCVFVSVGSLTVFLLRLTHYVAS